MKRKIFKFLFFFGLVCFAIGTIAVVSVFVYYSFKVPKHTNLEDYQPSITSRLYSSNGILLKEYADEKRIFTPIENIPNIVKNAFISAEDKNFYKHRGIDPQAIISASIYNVFAYFNKQQFRGGSTITQQVVKNLLLTNERTVERKIKEAILSYRITKDFSKDKVLELYLNHIYLGNNAYGVASAALNYFSKSLNEITTEEAALLAAMPKAPGKLNPVNNYDAALARRNWVLERMYKDGYIGKSEYEKAITQPINLQRRKFNRDFNYGAYVEEVRKTLSNMYSEESLMKDGFVVSTTIEPKIQKALDDALKNGLEAYDRRHGYRKSLGNIADNNEDFSNNWAEKLREFEIKEYYREDWQRAVILEKKKDRMVIGLLENEHTDNYEYDELIEINEIKAKKSYILLNNLKWVISPELLEIKTDENGNKIEYKIETINDVNLNIGDVIFVGSTAKDGYLLKQTPQVNGGAVALDPHTGRVLGMVGGYIDSEITFNRVTQAKRQPGSVIKPFVYLTAFENGYKPTDTIMDEEIVLPQGLGVPNYRPKNFSNTYHGLVTLRTALQNSYNVATVRLVSELGVSKVTNTIKRFGINERPKRVYSVVLGSVESHLINMARAYSMIVNGGKYIDIETIEKIQDKYGKTIYKRDERECKNCIITDKKLKIEDIEVPFLEEDRKSISDEASTYQIISILEGVVNYGTAWRAKSIGKIIGGKTGTSNDFRDAWFIGFSPDIVIGVYVGFDDNRSLGENETGSRAALPIFIDAAKVILKDEPSTPFRVPSDIVLKRIDSSTGKSPTLISKDKNIIFEAFKTKDLKDIEEDTHYNNEEENVFRIYNEEDGVEENNQNYFNGESSSGDDTSLNENSSEEFNDLIF